MKIATKIMSKICVLILCFVLLATNISCSVLLPTKIPAQKPPQGTLPVFVPPIITHPDEIDKDFNGIEDALESKITTCSKNELEEPIAVIVILNQPYTETDLDSFLSTGGEIEHKYDRVTYGFSGTVPPSKINELAESLGDKLNIIEQDHPTEAHLDISTQIIRARNTVWNTYGYRGDPDSAIAVIDSGIDDTHTDLSGYQDAFYGWPAANIKVVGWDDEIGATVSPVDYDGHGTHTASIAAGTGASAGNGTISQLITTFSGQLPGTSGYGFLDRILLPTTGTINLNMAWAGAGAGKDGRLNCRDTTDSWMGGVTSDSPPIIKNYNADVAGAYKPFCANSGGLGGQPFSCLETYPYADVGDGENLFTGVAPETHLVGVRVYPGYVSDMIDGYNWVVANKNTYRIKVATSSIGLSGAGTDIPLRNAANTVVANGIVFTVSAGNDYPYYKIGDPGLASKVICVGATNDEDGMTDYSSNGGYGSNKPDVVAPGGSSNVESKITAADTNDCDGEVSTFADRNANDYTNMKGTSMATPHVGGLAALVVQAMEDMGLTWTWNEIDALKVKSIILMTAGETNNAVHPGESTNDPPLNRGANDLVEGYGRVNADAAIEAVTMNYTIGTTAQDTLGQNPTNKRVWARQVSLAGGQLHTFSLTVPAGADFDLYLYDGAPGTYGTPTILEQSTTAATGGTETITYIPPSSTNTYIVVKWVNGSGQFSLDSTTLDHFKCYEVEETPSLNSSVSLEDQFIELDALVTNTSFFCNPVEKWHDGEPTPILNPDHHLTVYNLTCEDEPQLWQVTVNNQFGNNQDLTVSGPVGLAVPTQKKYPEFHDPPVGLDHYLLYEVIDGEDVNALVNLTDQFGYDPGVAVGQAVFFANPVQKTHGGNVTDIMNPYGHLVFYEILSTGASPPQVQIDNQFGPQTLNVTDPDLLAVPSEKIISGTVDTVPPTITGRSPTGSSVPVDSSITIDFSESMDTTSAENAFSISPTVPGSFSWTGDSMTFNPTTDLAYSTEHTVTIDGTAMDSAGNGLDGNANGTAEGSPVDDYTWSFTTEAAADGGGCFIATAAYSTPMAEEIQILREFRDDYLLANPLGQALVDLYYRVSPPIAEFITEHPSLKPIVRAGLLPAVAMSTVAVNTTPTEKAAIIGLVVLVSVAAAVWATRRQDRSPRYT